VCACAHDGEGYATLLGSSTRYAVSLYKTSQITSIVHGQF
jgi:hypothetical protein